MAESILLNVDYERVKTDSLYRSVYESYLEMYKEGNLDEPIDFYEEYILNTDGIDVEVMMYYLKKGKEVHVSYCPRMGDYGASVKLREWIHDNPEFETLFGDWIGEQIDNYPSIDINMKVVENDVEVNVYFWALRDDTDNIHRNMNINLETAERMIIKLSEEDTFGLGCEDWNNYC